MAFGNTHEEKVKFTAVQAVRDAMKEAGIEGHGERVYIEQNISMDDKTTADMLKMFGEAAYYIVVGVGDAPSFKTREYYVRVGNDLSIKTLSLSRSDV